MKQTLSTYLEEVELGLQSLSSGRRRLFLRELENHLLDEAEARGIADEAGMERLLAEKESPSELAGELSSEESVDTFHRKETALLGGALLGVVTGSWLWLQVGWTWYMSLAFGLAHGLAVGAGMFMVRPRWQRLSPAARLGLATLLGTLLAFPLGFTSQRVGFLWTRLIYGGFTGYLVERHAVRHPLWQLVLETFAFTALDYTLLALIRGGLPRYHLWHELGFNFILALGVLGALRLKQVLSERWLLRSQNQF